jgi:hypothetical protein
LGFGPAENKDATAARLPRDGEGGLEGFFGGRRVRWIALQHCLAPDAMNFRIEGAMFGAFDFGKRSIERSKVRNRSPRSPPRGPPTTRGTTAL